MFVIESEEDVSGYNELINLFRIHKMSLRWMVLQLPSILYTFLIMRMFRHMVHRVVYRRYSPPSYIVVVVIVQKYRHSYLPPSFHTLCGLTEITVVTVLEYVQRK
jgi:cytochrome c oxidase subunit IV